MALAGAGGSAGRGARKHPAGPPAPRPGRKLPAPPWGPRWPGTEGRDRGWVQGQSPSSLRKGEDQTDTMEGSDGVMEEKPGRPGPASDFIHSRGEAGATDKRRVV